MTKYSARTQKKIIWILAKKPYLSWLGQMQRYWFGFWAKMLQKSVRYLCVCYSYTNQSDVCVCYTNQSDVCVCYTNQSDDCVYATQISQMFVCILHKSVRYLCMPHKSVEASAPAMSGSVWIRNSDHFWDSLVWNLITFRNAVCSYVIKLSISIFKLYWK